MGDGIYAALSGAIAQTTALDTTAQNLANANTAGYRSLQPVFREVLSQANIEGQPLRFTVVSGTNVVTKGGAIRDTGRGLDIVLPENSFLAVETPGGERYTRASSLRVDADGVLKASGGEPVLSETKKEKIKVDPHADVTITEDGLVSVDGQPGERIRIVSFDNPAELVPEGSTLFAAGGAGNPTVTGGAVQVGALEDSNASPVTSMHQLITTTRLFEAFERIISAFHDADRKVASTVAK